jgi:hypothetical protein
MRPSRWKSLVLAFAVFLSAAYIIWPMIDRQLMEIPITDGITALRNGNVAKLAQSFTRDARISSSSATAAVSELLDRLAPRIVAGDTDDSLRFGGYANLQHHGRLVTADVTFIYDIQNEDLPYRSLPTRWTEGVTLEKHGLFSWQVKAMHLHDDALSMLLKRWLDNLPSGQ